jgi:uncharacterized repeat protein (TIGR02543 family)
MGIAPTYDVSFDSNGGTEIETQSIISQGKVTEPTPPTKDGYTFAGWFTDDDTFQEEWTFASDTVSEAFTLHAKWTENEYTITYNLDGGDNNVGNPATFGITDLDITLLDATKDSYTFGGWYTEDTYENLVTSITTIGNVVLYAKFTVI